MRLAIQRDTKSEVYRFQYGMLLTNAMAPKAAVIRITEALEVYPDSPRLWLGPGIAHFKAGNNPDDSRRSAKRRLNLKRRDCPWKFETNHFGTNEFLRCCQLSGAEGYLAANVRGLSAHDFFEWIEYCNSSGGVISYRFAPASVTRLQIAYD